jgi:autotransporter-associated beta strand protein
MGWENYNLFDTDVFDTTRGLTASNAVVFIDGIRREATDSFAKPGYQILAVRNPSADSVYRLGCNSTRYSMGGFQLAEIYIFQRQLSDEEMNDLSAYLANKWFGSELTGYAAKTRKRKAPDIAKLSVDGNSVFSVAPDKVTRIGEMELGAQLTVNGGGTLEIGEIKNPRGMSLNADGATVKVTGHIEPETKCEIAPDPAFHLDPADSGNFETELSDGTNFVMRARDEYMRHELFAPSATRRPWLDPSIVSGALPVLNFGAFGYYGSFMSFDRPIDAVRSVYAVWAPTGVGEKHYGFMFGSTDRITRDPLRGRLYDYHCGNSANADLTRHLFAGNSYQEHITLGEIYVDGVRTNRTYSPKAGELHLVELHHTAPAHIAALATDRKLGDPGRNGGSIFGETLIYTRVLTEREKVATRNYLMKKWFGKTDDELTALPESAEVKMGKLAGDGNFVKVGGNTLEVQDVSAYTGTVTVSEGTLKLARPLPQSVPAIVTDGLIFHVDANRGIELVEGTDNKVRKWNSVLNDGWCAIAAKELFDNHQYASYPTLKTGMYDSTPFVQMNHSYQYMVFYKNGVRSRMKDIKTVFWVIGTDDGTGATLGGGFLLGGGNAANPDGGGSQWVWHRGGSNAGAYKNSFDDPLTGNSATAVVRDGKWYVDGENVDGYTTGLGSNKWHYITAVPAAVSATRPYVANADGFAFDGRLMEKILAGQPEEVRHRAGGQSLAEVLIYNRTLSDSERMAVESYLSAKWGFTQTMPTNAVNLEINAGATVASDGKVYFASVSGAGTVDGDLTAGRLLADAEADACPLVTGAFIPGEKLTVELRNLPASTDGLKIKLLECGDFVLGENGCEIVYEGEVPDDGVDARLLFKDGSLYLRFRRRGTRIIIR